MNIFDLAREDTQLKKVAAQEYAGPCPGCGGRDRFHVNLTKRGNGGWMCRVCHPAEIKGWGDDVDYLVELRGMSKREAMQIARERVNSLLDHTASVLPYAAPDDDQPPRANWQEKAQAYVERAQYALWHTPAGKTALEYARGRGLEDSTIKAAQLGFSIDQDQAGNTAPYLVIPWHVGGLTGGYWAINRRDMREDRPEDAPKYKMLFGSSKQGLYGGALLERTRKYATFLVEGELDALILAQEARGLDINVVATGGQNSILTRWAIRLSRMPIVFLSQDNESRGSDQARAWLDVLQSNAIRYRPLEKDINVMHLEGWSVRTWIEAALDMLQVEQPGEATLTGPVPEKESSSWRCETCRGAIEDREGAYHIDLEGDGGLYCLSCWSKRPDQQPAPRVEQDSTAFLDQVRALVGESGAWANGYSLRLVDKTFVEQIRALPDQVPEPYIVRSSLEQLPRKHCAALVWATRDIPGETRKNRVMIAQPCASKPLANGWCKDHQRSHLLLTMGATLGYPRVEVSDCNVIPAGLCGWEQYAARAHTGMKAALPRVKRLFDQARDQDQAAS